MYSNHHETCGICHTSGPCEHSVAALHAELVATITGTKTADTVYHVGDPVVAGGTYTIPGTFYVGTFPQPERCPHCGACKHCGAAPPTFTPALPYGPVWYYDPRYAPIC